MKKIYLIRETKKFMTAELNNWGATNYIYIYIYIYIKKTWQTMMV